ncbi:MAG: serine protease [Nanoarchaeota archaeon]
MNIEQHSYSGSSTILRNDDEDEYFALTAAHTLIHEGDYIAKKVTESNLTVGDIPAEVFKSDPAVDLALLRILGDREYFKGKIAREVQEGQPLISIGYPSDQPKTIFTGELLDVQEKRWYADLGLVSKGVSGSGVYAVIEGKIQMIGTIVTKHGEQQIGMVSLHDIRHFLESTPVEDEYCK